MNVQVASVGFGEGEDGMQLDVFAVPVLERAPVQKAPDSNRNRWFSGHFPFLQAIAFK
jgi:hypothetical protein